MIGSGSPPRVRGKLDKNIEEETKFGITPACAGKTLKRMYLLSWLEDHPRVCGENAECRNLSLIV